MNDSTDDNRSHLYYQHNNNMYGNQSHFNHYTANRASSRRTPYQQHSNQFMINNQQTRPQQQQQQQRFTSHLASNSIQNQFGSITHNKYTTKDISCPGCKLRAIICREYSPDPSKNRCVYGHATKLDYINGSKLFCDFGKKKHKGGGCTHSKCNRNHEFDGTNFHLVKCPRECAHSSCYLKKQGKCPYFHDGTIGINGQKKWDQGLSAYGSRPKSDNNNNNNILNHNESQFNDTDQKSNNISKSTKDLACIYRNCRNVNLCQYAHPNRNNKNDEHNYYCQYGDGCPGIREGGYCFNLHEYEWHTDESPKEYICQFWAKGGRGCRSDADKCWMYHPNGKYSKDQ